MPRKPKSALPALPDSSLPEKKKVGRPPKSKADKLEEKAYAHIMELFESYEQVKSGADLQQLMRKDPYLASQIVKDLNQLTKQILNITVAKLRLEEARLQKALENKNDGNTGTKNVFIIQGLYDSSAPKAIEVTTDDGPVKFQTKGLEG